MESTEKGNEAEKEGQARTVRVSQLNLVDLAGSERAKATGMQLYSLKSYNMETLITIKIIRHYSSFANPLPFEV